MIIDNLLLKDATAAGIAHAVAWRLFYNYLHARERAETSGADVSRLPSMPWSEVDSRYRALVDEWLGETPDTARAVRAFVDFATATLIDRQISELFDVGSIVGDEQDREHAIRALMAIGNWLNQKEVAEYASKARAG
jgi:hypothetical protein